MPVFDLAQCVPKLEAQFASQPDMLLVYVFGSQAKGKAHGRSDLDVAVLLAGDPDDATCTQRRLDMIGDLMSLFHTNDVDVVVLNQADLVLRYQVVQYGSLAFVREHNVAVEFRVRTLNLYFDFAPFLIERRAGLLSAHTRGQVSGWIQPLSRHAFPRSSGPCVFCASCSRQAVTSSWAMTALYIQSDLGDFETFANHAVAYLDRANQETQAATIQREKRT